MTNWRQDYLIFLLHPVPLLGLVSHVFLQYRIGRPLHGQQHRRTTKNTHGHKETKKPVININTIILHQLLVKNLPLCFQPPPCGSDDGRRHGETGTVVLVPIPTSTPSPLPPTSTAMVKQPPSPWFFFFQRETTPLTDKHPPHQEPVPTFNLLHHLCGSDIRHPTDRPPLPPQWSWF